MKKLVSILFVMALVLSFAAFDMTPDPTPSGTVVVYSPHEADPFNAGINLFMQKYPNVKVEPVLAGTGECLQRIEAEAANPQADVMWGGGLESMAAYKDYYQAYTPKEIDALDPSVRGEGDLYMGESPLPMVIFYNKKYVSEEKAAELKTWDGLLDPDFKGHIAYASPAKSGSAYTQLVTMLLAHGGDTTEGWDFITKFYKNLDGKVNDSSGNCHKLVASGEYWIGLTLEKSAVQYKDNADVAYVYPEKDSAVPDGVAIVKNCPHPELAKLFEDFVLSKDCQTEQNKDFGRRPARKDVELGDLPALSDLNLVTYDFDLAANHKDDLVAKWQDVLVNN